MYDSKMGLQLNSRSDPVNGLRQNPCQNFSADPSQRFLHDPQT